MNKFALKFIEATGADLHIFERARAGKLESVLFLEDFCRLIDDENFNEVPRAIRSVIQNACETGALKCSVSKSTARRPPYVIHQDDARRYFQSLNLMPEEGTALWCWLQGKLSHETDPKLRRNQRDKADFQQLCMEHWKVSPLTRITGEDGIVNALGNPFPHYGKQREKWAREVAPLAVSSNVGRPKKLSPD